MTPASAASATSGKSPKAVRRPKTPEPRQVRFGDAEEVPSSYTNRTTKTQGFTTANSPSGGFDSRAKDHKESSSDKPSSVPDHFPQVGIAPGGSLQWHTAANPSLSIGNQLASTCTYTNPAANPQNQHPQPVFLSSQQFLPPGTHTTTAFVSQPSSITYIGVPQQLSQAAMGDYQNTAPPSAGGVHFQPPVPDTTFGPIPHVYVPRSDGIIAPGVTVSGVQPSIGPVQAQSIPGSYVVAQQPYYVQQPIVGQQPVMVNGQPALIAQAQAQAMPAVPTVGLAGGAFVSGAIPVNAGNFGHHVPEVSGLGRTAGEEAVRQHNFAQKNGLFKPQDFKPADDDPGRFYYFREVDGAWTQRSRHDIDNLGDCRWYVHDEGWFYAAKLA